MFSSPISMLRTGNTAKATKTDSLNSTVDTDDTRSLNSSYDEDDINEDINDEGINVEDIYEDNNEVNSNENALSIITFINSVTTAEEEVDYRRGCRDTYAEPLIFIQKDDFRKFMTTFYRTIYKRKKECEDLRKNYPDTIGKYYNELVDEDYDGGDCFDDYDYDENKRIGYEDFWQRYFYRCDIERIEKERKKNEIKNKDNNKPKLENEFVQSVKKLFAMQ